MVKHEEFLLILIKHANHKTYLIDSGFFFFPEFCRLYFNARLTTSRLASNGNWKLRELTEHVTTYSDSEKSLLDQLQVHPTVVFSSITHCCYQHFREQS